MATTCDLTHFATEVDELIDLIEDPDNAGEFPTFYAIGSELAADLSEAQAVATDAQWSKLSKAQDHLVEANNTLYNSDLNRVPENLRKAHAELKG